MIIHNKFVDNLKLELKSRSLQTDPRRGRVQLTPAYDIICTYIYKDQKMALKLDGRDHNFKRCNFVEFGVRMGL